jgi:hypothetical protein
MEAFFPVLEKNVLGWERNFNGQEAKGHNGAALNSATGTP